MKKYFILAAVAATFAACSFDKDLGESSSPTSVLPEERVPLDLGYSLGGLTTSGTTRGNFSDVQNTTVLNGEKESDATTEVKNNIGLFILKESATTTTESYEQLNLTSSSLTTNDPTNNYYGINTTSSLSYPENKSQKLDIYAYAPFISGTWTTGTDNITTKKISFTTETNQTTKANYMASDVLWGCAGTGTYVAAAATSGPYNYLSKTANNNEISADAFMTAKGQTQGQQNGAYYTTNNAPVTAPAIIPLLHRGSKIIIRLKASGMELAKLQNAEVKFYVDKTTGELDISDGSFSTTGTETPTAITLTDRLGIKATVPNAGDAVDDEGKITESGIDYYVCSAVIIPQKNWKANGDDAATSPTTKGASNIIEIDLYSDNRAHGTSSNTATYGYKTGLEAITYESGKVYTYTITVTASGLTVTTTVADWETGSSGTGSAVLQ